MHATTYGGFIQPQTTDAANSEPVKTPGGGKKTFNRTVSTVTTTSMLEGLETPITTASQDETAQSKEPDMLFPEEGLTFSAQAAMDEKYATVSSDKVKAAGQSIESAQIDFKKYNNKDSAYLLIWGSYNHSAMVLGTPKNSTEAAYNGATTFVNWCYDPVRNSEGQISATLNLLMHLSNIPHATLDGTRVPYTSECHRRGRPEVYEFSGLDVNKMFKTWTDIRKNESYKYITNNCYSVTARVLKSGLSDQEQEKLGQPRMGIWSKHNIKVLANRMSLLAQKKPLPEANEPLLSQETKNHLKSFFVSESEPGESEKVALYDTPFFA